MKYRKPPLLRSKTQRPARRPWQPEERPAELPEPEAPKINARVFHIDGDAVEAIRSDVIEEVVPRTVGGWRVYFKNRGIFGVCLRISQIAAALDRGAPGSSDLRAAMSYAEMEADVSPRSRIGVNLPPSAVRALLRSCRVLSRANILRRTVDDLERNLIAATAGPRRDS